MSDRNTVWVTGAKGFVGGLVCKALEKEGFIVAATDIEVSVTEPERLNAFAEQVQPGVIINCAGIPRASATGLSNRVKAYEINALGARNMAVVANAFGATIVQVSTDDVYNLQLDEFVNEFDNPHPNTAYGKSKRAGEMMVRDTTADHIIVRASWLYDMSGRTLKEILDAAKEGKKYAARVDQFAAPTSMDLYMKFMIAAIRKGATGTFHVATKGKASRYEFASRALELAGYDPKSVLEEEADAATAENLVLESMMLEMVGVSLPSWEDDLREHMKKIQA